MFVFLIWCHDVTLIIAYLVLSTNKKKDELRFKKHEMLGMFPHYIGIQLHRIIKSMPFQQCWFNVAMGHFLDIYSIHWNCVFQYGETMQKMCWSNYGRASSISHHFNWSLYHFLHRLTLLYMQHVRIYAICSATQHSVRIAHHLNRLREKSHDMNEKSFVCDQLIREWIVPLL